MIEPAETQPDTRFADRVIKERDALASNHTALRTFINTSEVYVALPDAEKMRLSRQFSAMGLYLEALNERITADFQ